MAQENAIFDEQKKLYQDSTEMMNLDELEENLQSQLDESFADLEFLKEEREKIGNPDHLGNVIQSVVWEQFINQVAMTAGEDFIKENRGLTLDLRNSAHIQTPENFAKGKIADHNYISGEQLKQNYERYKNMPHGKFRKNYVDPGMNATLPGAGTLHENGIDTVTDIYTGRQIPTATKLPNGKNNPKAAQREHVIPSAELYDNPSLQMANNNEDLAAIINNPNNLQGYTTADRNNRKSDKSPDEMNDQDKNKHWQKAHDKAEEYIKQQEKKGEDRLKQEGRKTQREEASRIGRTALRSILMQMLADLVKKIIGKLVVWFKSTKRTLDSLIESIKESIISFVTDIKARLINAGNIALNTIAAAIYGPVFGTIKKVWMLLKQGWRALKDAVDYIRKPENKGKPIDRLILETGKILVAGLTGVSAILLGEGIEKGLMTIPVFAIEIPMLGSLANILGIFFGAVVAGITGAIAINLIDKYIEKQQKRENLKRQIEKKNEILDAQNRLTDAKVKKMIDEKERSAQSIKERHEQAQIEIRDALTTIFQDNKNEDSPEVDDRLRSSSNKLDELLS